MRADYYTFKENIIMRTYSIQATFVMLLAMTATSCVDRKTQKDEDAIRLEEPADNSADTDFTESLDMTVSNEGITLSNEDLVEIAEAKGIIND